MSYNIALPLSGYAGWGLLKRTLPLQQAALQNTPTTKREVAYFREAITKVSTAADLVADRRLLKFALTAFGLEDDLNAKAFIKTVLAQGSDQPSDLANRLADKRYLAFSQSFALDGTGPAGTKAAGFAEEVIALYHAKIFEAAVGAQNGDYRIALNAEREIPLLAKRDLSEAAKWFTVMGNKPLREVFETTLSLPSSFGKLDIDQQHKVFKARARAVLAIENFSELADPKKLEKLITIFITKSSVKNGAQFSPAQAALQLLSVRSDPR